MSRTCGGCDSIRITDVAVYVGVSTRTAEPTISTQQTAIAAIRLRCRRITRQCSRWLVRSSSVAAIGPRLGAPLYSRVRSMKYGESSDNIFAPALPDLRVLETSGP